MEIAITKKAFKSQAQKQHAALKARNVAAKLSDIQESLAIAYGYENLATLYAKFSEEAFSVVDVKALYEQTNNLFVLTRADVEMEDFSWQERLSVYSPEVTMQDIIDAGNKYSVSLYDDECVALDKDWVFSKETVGLSTFAIIARPGKYGFPDCVNDDHATDWVKSFGFRVPKGGVDIDYFDTGDDGCGGEYLLIWVPDEEAARIRKLFDSDPQSGDLF